MNEKTLREKIRSQGKESSTADAYWHWWQRYVGYVRQNKIGKETQAERAVERFLSTLANHGNVSSNTQNQAFSALCYVYRHCLNRPLENVSALRAKAPQRVREVAKYFRSVREMAGVKGGGFSWLRKTFATYASECADQIAVDAIMGHVDDSIPGQYRQLLRENRLHKATDTVHAWLFGE